MRSNSSVVPEKSTDDDHDYNLDPRRDLAGCLLRQRLHSRPSTCRLQDERAQANKSVDPNLTRRGDETTCVLHNNSRHRGLHATRTRLSKQETQGDYQTGMRVYAERAGHCVVLCLSNRLCFVAPTFNAELGRRVLKTSQSIVHNTDPFPSSIERQKQWSEN